MASIRALSKPKRWCGGWGYIIRTADQTVWDVATVRVECRGCSACRAYRIELTYMDIGGNSPGNSYIIRRYPERTIVRQFQCAAEAEEWIRTQVAGRVQ